MAISNADPALKNEVVTSIREPSLYRVIYLNDDVTSFEFVIDTLVNIFEYSEETSSQIAHDVHDQGSAVVAVLPFELAEQKTAEVLLYAKANKFPLQTIIEPED